MRTEHLLLTPLVVIALMLAGCSGADTLSAPAPASSTAPTRDDAKEAAASKAALAAYEGYLTVSRTASAKPDPFHPDLKKYLADPLLTRIRVAIRDLDRHDAIRTGSLVSDPQVTLVDLSSTPPTVSIQDCIDTTGYKMVYAKDKKQVPGTAGGRYMATATATLYPDGRWLISDGASHTDQPC